MVNKQQRFEESIYMESDLNAFDDEKHYKRPFNIDNMSCEYNSLVDIIGSNNTTDTENRNKLIIYINYKFSLLTQIQKKVAEYRFYHGYTIKKIAQLLNKDTSTIHYHLENIAKKW